MEENFQVRSSVSDGGERGRDREGERRVVYTNYRLQLVFSIQRSFVGDFVIAKEYSYFITDG